MSNGYENQLISSWAHNEHAIIVITDKFQLSGYHGTLLLSDNQICRIIGYLFPLDINLIRNREI